MCMGIDQTVPSFFILVLECLALATSEPLVMADFTKAGGFHSRKSVASLAGFSGPVKKNSLPVNQNGGKIIQAQRGLHMSRHQILPNRGCADHEHPETEL